MKKVVFTAFVLFSFAKFSAFAQVNYLCGTDLAEQLAYEKYPSLIIDQQKFDEEISAWIAAHPEARTSGNTIYIPLVFHIIHDYGTENITDAQVQDEVRILNRDYAKLNADTSYAVEAFKPLIGKTNFQFRLANLDPNGECTNGIDHVHSLRTNNGGDNAKLNDWPRANYVNIWTVRKFGGVYTGAAAYAYLPATAAMSSYAPYDGVIALSTYVGSIGTGTGGTSRAITHEIGHVFNLLHPWGMTNQPGVECGDDGVFDTPETKGWSSCDTAHSAVCNPPIQENVQNYMEYSYCSCMFTDDQVARVEAAANSAVAQRNNLWTQTNMAVTGITDSVQTICSPRVDFFVYPTMGSVLTPVTFNDASFNGIESSRLWTFQDGNPATSSLEDPSVSFTSPGWKTVTLSVTNPAGTTTLQRQNYIYVGSATAQFSGSMFFNFEDTAQFSDFIVQNPEGNNSTFHLTSVGYNSSRSVQFNGYQNMASDIDYLITPSVDLSGSDVKYLNFYYSGATATSKPNDQLIIFSSSDNGRTWYERAAITTTTLANKGFVGPSYIPSQSTDWVFKSIALPVSLNQPNTRFRFEYISGGGGNNLYIDNISAGSTATGIADLTALQSELQINPNPIHSSGTIIFNNIESGNVIVKIANLSGQIVQTLYNGNWNEGQHVIEFSGAPVLTPGIYVVMIDNNAQHLRSKLIVQ